MEAVLVEISTVDTAWGWVGLAVSAVGIRAVTLPKPTDADALNHLRAELGTSSTVSCTPPAEIAEQLKRYFEGQPIPFRVRLDLPDRPVFWRKVWDVVAAIPYGETASYGEVAGRAGMPTAARAVGGAMANNPVPLIVPCHRVVGSDGRLIGFGGGLNLKRRLLAMEHQAALRLPSLSSDTCAIASGK